MKKLILISGKAEHGKTTVAELLKSALQEKGYNVVVTRYAYYLKDIAKRYCSWNGIKDEHGRNLLQSLGTDIIRKKLNKPNFHVGRVCEDIEICQDFVDYVIVDDARFLNEIYYSQAIFGDKVVSIRVNRCNEDGTPYSSSLTEEQKKHLSEIALDYFDFDYGIRAKNMDDIKIAVSRLVQEIE